MEEAAASTAVSEAKRRVLEHLKRVGEASASELATVLGLTDVAVRQHLVALEERGLVEQSSRPPVGPGRPAAVWSLTEVARGLFPDRHADLTVQLIDAMREAVGQGGLDDVMRVRTEAQLAAYRKAIGPPGKGRLRRRVEALARQRTAEGYMAEMADPDGDGVLLIENHCPICDAARACVGFCRSELELFQQALGDDVTVERVEHVIAGDRRCTYRVRPRS